MLFASLSGWLIYAAMTLKVDYYDGLDTIMNVGRFTGDYSSFISNRAPMMSILLIPSYLLNSALDLDLLDFRSYHLTTALVHIAYLYISYLLLMKLYARRLPVLLAFLFAVPNFLFFSYAPFISHDIAPGAILFGMLVLADRFMATPGPGTWISLVILGALSALIKHIYGLFWVSILITFAISSLAVRVKHNPATTKNLLLLALGALSSGGITWVCLAWVLHADPAYSDTPFMLAPLKQLEFLATGAADGRLFPVDIYLQNMSAFGVIAVLLLPFGLFMSIKANGLQRSISIAFIIMVLFMHVTPNREVRYLAHLSPLVACIIVPPVTFLIEKWRLTYLLILVLLASLTSANAYSPLDESLRIFHPFYRQNPYQKITRTLNDHNSGPLLINWNMLEFPAPIKSPLVDDPYHRRFHFGIHHLSRSMGYRDRDILFAKDDHFLLLEEWPENMAIIVRKPGSSAGTSGDMHSSLDDIHQTVLFDDSLQLTVNGQLLFLQYPRLQQLARLIVKNDKVYLHGEGLAGLFSNKILSHLHIANSETSYPVMPSESGSFEVVGLRDLPVVSGGIPAKLHFFTVSGKN